MAKKETQWDRRKKLALAKTVAKRLNVKRANAVLFTAVAAALGRTWVIGTRKQLGYQMVEEYAVKVGMTATGAIKEGRVGKPCKAALPKEATNDFLMTFEWRRLRMQVLKKRGARCECCGASPRDGVTVLNVDHVKPRKLFPELALDESNLQVLCSPCNHGKGNWDQTDWRAEVI